MSHIYPPAHCVLSSPAVCYSKHRCRVWHEYLVEILKRISITPPSPSFPLCVGPPLHPDMFLQAAGGQVGLEHRSCTQLLEDLILVSITEMIQQWPITGEGTAQNHTVQRCFGPSDPQTPHGGGNVPLW